MLALIIPGWTKWPEFTMPGLRSVFRAARCSKGRSLRETAAGMSKSTCKRTTADGRLLPDAEQAASGHSSAIPGNNERRQMPNFSGLAY
jgi:hypothetical protein